MDNVNIEVIRDRVDQHENRINKSEDKIQCNEIKLAENEKDHEAFRESSKRVENKLDILVSKSGKRWDSLISAVFTAVAIAAVSYLMSQILK